MAGPGAEPGPVPGPARGSLHVFLLCNMTFNCITSSAAHTETEAERERQRERETEAGNEQVSTAGKGEACKLLSLKAAWQGNMHRKH